jgi:hypothetical protein
MKTIKLNNSEIQLTTEQVEDLKKQLDTVKDVHWNEKCVDTKGEYHIIVSNSNTCFTTMIVNANPDTNIGTCRQPKHAFHTQEEAELCEDKFTLMVELHNFCRVKNEGWVADWENGDAQKWGVIFSRNLEVEDYWSINGFLGGFSVKSKEIAEEMLAEFGDRLLIFNKQ